MTADEDARRALEKARRDWIEAATTHALVALRRAGFQVGDYDKAFEALEPWVEEHLR